MIQQRVIRLRILLSTKYFHSISLLRLFLQVLQKRTPFFSDQWQLSRVVTWEYPIFARPIVLRAAAVRTQDLGDIGEEATPHQGGGAAVADEALAVPVTIIK